MIVEAISKRTNLDKDNARIDVFNPRFKFRPLMSIDIKYAYKKVKLFTSWDDIPNDKCITVNDNKMPKNKKPNVLVRGMLVCCGDNCDCCVGENTVFIYMPEELAK